MFSDLTGIQLQEWHLMAGWFISWIVLLFCWFRWGLDDMGPNDEFLYYIGMPILLVFLAALWPVLVLVVPVVAAIALLLTAVYYLARIGKN